MKLYEWRPGHQPRPRRQTIAQRTPAMAPQNKSWRPQSQFFKQHDRPNRAMNPKHKGYPPNFDSCTAVAVPRVHFRAPSANARDAESDNFLACVAKKKRLAAARTYATTHAVALVCSRWSLSPGRCVKWCVFSISIKNRTIRGLRSDPNPFFFHPIQFKQLNWTHFFSSLKPGLTMPSSSLERGWVQKRGY